MDLCSDDSNYRKKSISNLKEVVKKTLELKPYFLIEKATHYH